MADGGGTAPQTFTVPIAFEAMLARLSSSPSKEETTMWFVYLLRCSDNSLYCGITNNLNRRINQHNSSSRGAKYTRARRPVILAYSTSVENRSEASKLEAKIKKMTKKQKEEMAERGGHAPQAH
jgi:putative endonuclease